MPLVHFTVNEIDDFIWKPNRDLLAHGAMVPVWDAERYRTCKNVWTLQHTKLRRNYAKTCQLIAPTVVPAIAPSPCRISTDALLRIGRNTAESNMAGYR